MNAAHLRYRLCAFFAANPDEELTIDDVCIKWDVPRHHIHNWLRHLPPALVAAETRAGRVHLSAGPELRLKSLRDLDELVAYVHEFPYPDLIKPLESLRAQFALDVAPFRERLVPLPIVDEMEPE